MPNLIEIQAALINFAEPLDIHLEDLSTLGRFVSKAKYALVENIDSTDFFYLFAFVTFACTVTAIGLSIGIRDKKDAAWGQFDVVKDATCHYNNGTMGERNFLDLCTTYRNRNSDHTSTGGYSFKKDWETFLITCCNATLTNQTDCQSSAYTESENFCQEYLPYINFATSIAALGLVALVILYAFRERFGELCFPKRNEYALIEAPARRGKSDISLSVAQSNQLKKIFDDIGAFQFAPNEDAEAFGGQLRSLQSLVNGVTLTADTVNTVSKESLQNIYRALKILTGPKETCCNLWSLGIGRTNTATAHEGRALSVVRPGNGSIGNSVN